MNIQRPDLESLEGLLSSVSTSCLTGLAALDLLSNPTTCAHLRGRVVTFGPNGMNIVPAGDSEIQKAEKFFALDQIADVFSNERAAEDTRLEFMKVMLCDFVSVGHQLLVARCEAVQATAQLWETGFFRFAKIIRNSMRHNFRIEYRDNRDREALPLTWRDRTLTREMEGEPLRLEFFGMPQAIHMHAEYVEFARALDAKLGIPPWPNRSAAELRS